METESSALNQRFPTESLGWPSKFTQRLLEICGTPFVLHLTDLKLLTSLRKRVLFREPATQINTLGLWHMIVLPPQLPTIARQRNRTLLATFSDRRNVDLQKRQVVLRRRTLDSAAEEVYHSLFWEIVNLNLATNGWLCLHASMVGGKAGAYAFVGPKGSGKTTLAILSIRRSKLRILSNDIVFVKMVGSDLYAFGFATPTIHIKRDSMDKLTEVNRWFAKSKPSLSSQQKPELEVDLTNICGEEKLAQTPTPVRLRRVFFPTLRRKGVRVEFVKLAPEKIRSLLRKNMWKYDPALVRLNVQCGDYFDDAMPISGRRLPGALEKSVVQVSNSPRHYSIDLPVDNIKETER